MLLRVVIALPIAVTASLVIAWRRQFTWNHRESSRSELDAIVARSYTRAELDDLALLTLYY